VSTKKSIFVSLCIEQYNNYVIFGNSNWNQ